MTKIVYKNWNNSKKSDDLETLYLGITMQILTL